MSTRVSHQSVSRLRKRITQAITTNICWKSTFVIRRHHFCTRSNTFYL